MKYLLILLTIFSSYGSAFASITEMGNGMLFGHDHAFSFTAKRGWVLDNESGINQGLHMVFYPAGETWSNSPVIIYGRTVSKSQVPTIKSQVEKTVKEFHLNNSPNYKASKQQSIKLDNGKFIEVYFFEGDQWGNYEAAGYIEEKDTINFLIYNARQKNTFDSHIESFKETLASYNNSYNKINIVQDKKFEKLLKEAKAQSITAEGSTYEKEILQKFGQKMADYVRSCISYLPDNKVNPFDLILKIESNGTVSETFVRPKTALSVCFDGSMLYTQYPNHNLGTFLHHINMNFK